MHDCNKRNELVVEQYIYSMTKPRLYVAKMRRKNMLNQPSLKKEKSQQRDFMLLTHKRK